MPKNKDPLDHPAFVRNDRPSDVPGDYQISCEEWGVYEWTPLPNGEGKCTQVHIIITPSIHFRGALGMDLRFIMRLKSKEACDAMIATLQRHRNNVWGDT